MTADKILNQKQFLRQNYRFCSLLQKMFIDICYRYAILNIEIADKVCGKGDFLW